MIDRAARHPGNQILVARGNHFAVRVSQTDEVECTVATSEQPEGGLEIAVAEDYNLCVVGTNLKDGLDPEPAPPLAGSGRVRQIFVPDQTVRRLLLEHLVVLVQHPSRSIDPANIDVTIGAAYSPRSALDPHD